MEVSEQQEPMKTDSKPRRLWDLPKEMAIIMLGGNLVMFIIGFALFKQMHFESPALLELAALLLIDVAILLARWKLPKTWSSISGEKL